MNSDSTFREDASHLWRTLRPVLLVLGFILGATITSLLVGIIGVIVLDLTAPASQRSPATVFLVAGALGEIGYAVFVGGLLYWKTDLLPDGLPIRLPTRRDVLWVLGGTIVMVVAEYALTILFSYFHIPTAQNAAALEATKHASSLMFGGLIVESLLIIGPCEEVLFRGLIQGYLRNHFSAVGSILLASLFFASAHLLSVQGSTTGVLNMILSLFGLSLVLGFAYERTNSLLVPVLIHGSYDAILFAGLGLTLLH